MFFDPPYHASTGRTVRLYRCENGYISVAVRDYCLEHGDNPLMRIALCGYEGEHDMPESWDVYAWSSHGMETTGDTGGKERRHSERIWFSPHCLNPQDALLGWTEREECDD
jgi:hypothetical protein